MGYKVSKVDINFGSKLYQQLNQSENRFSKYMPNIYAKIPSNGINYRIRYIDTNTVEEANGPEVVKTGDNNNDNSTKPLMVLLHGTPGSIVDFQEFCTEFGQRYRLIIPEFPDFEFSRNTGHFWHSNEERTQLIVSFLEKLSLSSIYCLICHSGGNAVALEIVSGDLNDKIEVRSLIMITPPGFKWLSDLQLKHMQRMCGILVSRWRHFLYRFLVPDWVKTFLGAPQALLKNCTKDELAAMILVATMSGYDCNLIEEGYKKLGAQRVPTLFVMGEKDNLFPKWKFYKTLDFMSANREELFTYVGVDGQTESESMANDWIQVLNFRFGGHFCFIKYSKVFHKYCDNFFKSVSQF